MKIPLIAVSLVLGLSTVAHARQYVVQQAGRVRIVHTRIVPVLIHRVFPPYTGVHIHESELRNR